MAEKIKRTSKYVGNTYQNWKVVDIFVKSVQGKKCQYKKVKNSLGHLVLAPSKYVGHQNYTYILERVTSDNVCNKRIAVNGYQMKKIADNELCVEFIADKYFGKAKTDYRFR